jgi:hypothetical protein
VGKNNLYRHGQSNTSSVNPRNNMNEIESKAELQSSSLEGWAVAYPTKHMVRQIKKIVPGTIPKASGLRWIGMEM